MNRMLLVAAVAVLLCSSCDGKNEGSAPSPAPPIETLREFPRPGRSYRPSDPNVIYVSFEEAAGSNKRGKELLEEYQVQPGQTIRFPYESHVFESHGDVPVTSLEEARNKYPDWLIPETLGSYQFRDLTLYKDRTDVVYHNSVPLPKDEIEVLEDEAPEQYFLCYEDASACFLINVFPGDEGLPAKHLMPYDSPGYRTLPTCPGAWLQPNEEDTSSFVAMLMTVEPGEGYGYAFFVRKISGIDCLESEEIPFTEEEAQVLYTSIQEEFLRELGLSVSH